MIEIKSSYPIFITDNLIVLKDFYLNTFGFTAAFFDPEFYLHLVHPESGSQLGFMLPNHPSQPEALHALSDRKGAIISFDISNTKEAFEQVKSSGLDIIMECKEEEWGQIHFIIRDPQGFMVDVGEYVNEQ